MNQATGFPRELLSLLRCIIDAGQLMLANESCGDDTVVNDGLLRCIECHHEYKIESGIVRLMPSMLSEESEHEIRLKDREYEAMPEVFEPSASGWRSEFADRIEIPPHMKALQPLNRQRVLELGCGDGRFTTLMAQQGATVLAVDFSLAALQKASHRLRTGVAPTSFKAASPHPAFDLSRQVGLVQADASYLRVTPRSFQRVLSATPLDSRDERMAMFRTVADALTDNGRYIAGVEYDDLRRRLLGMPKVRRYTPNGILIEHLDIPTAQREFAPYFDRMRMRPVRAHVPLTKWMPFALRVAVHRLVTVLPFVKHLGEILLIHAEQPRRLPGEAERRPDYFRCRSLYRRYKNWRGELAVWTEGDGLV
jgi:SAM-dependent methyltransferase